MSKFLISKQANIKTKKAIHTIKVEGGIVDNLTPGTKLNKNYNIEWYITKYYEKLYKKEMSDDKLKTWFLQFIEEKISDNISNVLDREVDNDEIFQAIKKLRGSFTILAIHLI